MSRNSQPNGVREVLEGDEVSDILREKFFATPEGGVPRVRAKPVRAKRSTRESGEPAPTEEPRVERTSAVPPEPPKPATKARPSHYKVICISMYTEDLGHLDEVVAELKRRGFTKANRSAVLRVAMEQLDLDRIPKGL